MSSDVDAVPLAEIAELTVGGVWGEDAPTDRASEAVYCLRGIDLDGLARRVGASPPTRFISSKQLASRLLEWGDIVIEASGSNCGRSIAASQSVADAFDLPLVYSNFCKRIRIRDTSRWHPLYVWRVLQSLYSSGDVQQYRTGSALPNLDVKRLVARFRVSDRPMEEQRAIAEVLSALDDRIEWCAGAVGRLEALLLELARGEAAAVPVAELAAYVNGGAYTKHATGTGRLVIRIAELSSGVGPSSKYADIEAPPERTAYPGDILFSWSATLDTYRWTADEAVVNQHIFKVLPSAPWPAWLVYAKLKEAMPTFQKIAHDRATTMGHIKRGHLEQVSVGLPDEAHLKQVRDLGDALWDQHLRASREQQHLANLREMLLPRLLSGDLRIEDPARVLGAVA